MMKKLDAKNICAGVVLGALLTATISKLISRGKTPADPKKKKLGKKDESKNDLPTVVYGTMTIPSQTSKDTAKVILEKLIQVVGAPAEIDTARVYEDGRTEQTLGEIFEEDPTLLSNLKIATKVNAKVSKLTKENVLKQFKASCEAMNTKSVDILYLHHPDADTPVLETLKGIQEIYEAGGFKEFGLSNYQSWEVVQIYYLCAERGWVVPTVYQGMYNCITREVERELLPALRSLGISFYAYNPLAGGFLTGKHTKESVANAVEGRFRKTNSNYRDRYLTESQFEALEVIRKACEKAKISMTEAAIRWEFHHSRLHGKYGDAVIIGASKLDHFDTNLEASTSKCSPLPDAVVKAMDEAWELIKKSGTCPSYERGFSKQPHQ